MELHMQSHHYVRRQPDWTAAAVSGLAAGALLLVLELFWSSICVFSAMDCGANQFGNCRGMPSRG